MACKYENLLAKETENTKQVEMYSNSRVPQPLGVGQEKEFHCLSLISILSQMNPIRKLVWKFEDAVSC
jgi:hypothetical protein